MAALAARKRISCKANLGSVQYASSIPLEAAAAAMRANDGFATSLKMSRAERLCDCGFNSALNCCDGLVHKCVIVGSSLTMIIQSACKPPSTPDFCKALCNHTLMKYDLRISVKDYRRGKNLKIQLAQLSFSSSRQFFVKMNGSP